jgi:bifunctional non-homologous end joining protein LigD
MLSRAGPLPIGDEWSFELKWDGFRAIVSTQNELRIRSRRGWNMTAILPELRVLSAGLVLDGELVAWRKDEPYFPYICRRVLNRDMSIPTTFVIFDLLWEKGVELIGRPYSERKRKLERLALDAPTWTTSETFDDGHALFTAVCALGFEGIVAKNHASLYRPNDRGWVKVKNPNYWRRDAEREAIARKHTRSVQLKGRGLNGARA